MESREFVCEKLNHSSNNKKDNLKEKNERQRKENKNYKKWKISQCDIINIASDYSFAQSKVFLTQLSQNLQSQIDTLTQFGCLFLCALCCAYVCYVCAVCMHL